jgi:O-antigen ligase
MMPLFHPLIRGLRWRLLVLAGIAGLGLALFHTQSFQERFFHSGHGTLGDLLRGDFSSTGRFDAWPYIWEEALRRPVLGHGVGSAYDFVPTVWSGMNHVHNEYLRLVYEVGFVGLAVFLTVVVWQGGSLRRRLRDSNGAARSALAAAFLGLSYFLMTAATGNPLPSNVWLMDPWFVLMGAAYGAAALTGPAPAPQRSRQACCEFSSSWESLPDG